MAEQEKKTVDIGQKIYEIRKSEGLSQTEFADKFHVTRQTVSNWEHGKNYPDMETLMRISDEYGITFDELIKSDRELIRSIDRSRKVASKSIMIFALLGVIVIAAVLVKLMPGIVSKLYYDPTKIVAKAVDEDGGYYETTRLELDARVYSELYLPQFKYEFAENGTGTDIDTVVKVIKEATSQDVFIRFKKWVPGGWKKYCKDYLKYMKKFGL